MLAHSLLWSAIFLMLPRATHLGRAGTTHSGLAPPTSIINRYHFLGDMATDQFDLSNSSPEIPLDDLALRRVKGVIFFFGA